MFNDGSGTTGNYECRVLAAISNAAPGFYRLGIVNFGADATTGQMFPQDLSPGSNYIVVTALNVGTGQSALWVNPATQNSPSVTDTTPHNATDLFNISDIELRESGTVAGSVDVSQLKVGTTFESVLPILHITAEPNSQAPTSVVLTSTDPTLGIDVAPVVTGPWSLIPGAGTPYTNDLSANMLFFKFGH